MYQDILMQGCTHGDTNGNADVAKVIVEALAQFQKCQQSQQCDQSLCGIVSEHIACAVEAKC